MSNTKKAAPVLKDKEITELEQIGTMSGKIRYLDSKGYARADVARALNIRYQWVRNVLIQPVTKK